MTAKHSLIVDHTECLIQLRLELAGREGSNMKNVHLELTMGEFNEFYR